MKKIGRDRSPRSRAFRMYAPPLFRAMPERKENFSLDVFPKLGSDEGTDISTPNSLGN